VKLRVDWDRPNMSKGGARGMGVRDEMWGGGRGGKALRSTVEN